jgi:nucleotide-binding universal stress UspA family protein
MIDLHCILVPTDFSKYSENAVKYAAAFAEKFGAELHILHVVQDMAVFIPEAVLVTPMMTPPIDQFKAAAQAALEKVIKDLNLSGLKVQTEIAQGVPFAEIIRTARDKDVDLIVMGTHGRTGLVHMLLGSVAEKVVRKAPCPVLTVRHPEHEFVHP